MPQHKLVPEVFLALSAHLYNRPFAIIGVAIWAVVGLSEPRGVDKWRLPISVVFY